MFDLAIEWAHLINFMYGHAEDNSGDNKLLYI